MLRKLYYTSEILTASLLATAIMLIIFIYDGIIIHGLEMASLISQTLLLFFFYFAFFFLAFFLLINLFDDYLKTKYNLTVVIIIMLVSINGILLIGLYVDTYYSVLEAIIANARVYISINIAVIFFSIKKGLTGKV